MTYFSKQLNSILSEEYVNVRDLQHSINQTLEPHLVKSGFQKNIVEILKDHTDNLVINVFVKDLDDKQRAKLIGMVDYFLKDLNVHHLEWKPSYDGWALEAGLTHYDKYEADDFDEQLERTMHNTNKDPETAKLELEFYLRQIEDGRLINIRDIGTEISPGLFKLNRFIDDVNFVDLDTLKHIVSTCKDMATGDMFAACDGRFHTDRLEPDFETIYLH